MMSLEEGSYGGRRDGTRGKESFTGACASSGIGLRGKDGKRAGRVG